MILKVKFKANYPSEGIRTMRLVEVIRQETPDGRDTHAVFEPGAFEEDETLCEGFFLPETNAKVLTPEMQSLLDDIKTIELPATIKKLRPNTFEGCGSLAELDIPNGIVSIPEMCFKDCEALKYCVIPDTVAEIDQSAFENCISLVSITLPDGMKSISFGCFRNCKSLLEMTVPSSIKVIGSSAFSDCINLKGILLPEGFLVIYDYCFSNCNSLNSINFPDSLQVIGPAAFYNCTSLREVSIPGGVKRIGQNSTEGTHSGGYNGVFENCRNLINVDLADGISLLSEKCFKNCIELEEVKLPSSLNSIDHSAFENCIKLVKIDLPVGIQYIDDNLFSGCTNLEQIMIPDSVETISYRAFSGCEKLSSISLPDSVKEIGRSAFQDCSTLHSISLPIGIGLIPDECFAGCTNLVETIIPSSVTEIGISSFEGCSKLSSVLLPDGVKLIGLKCFKDCHSLDEILIPDSVIEIGENVFENCSDLKSVTLPARMKTLAEELFTGTCDPETINYVESDTYIFEENLLLSQDGKTLIKYQKSDQKVFTIPENIVKINEDAFADSRTNGPEVLVFRHLLDNLKLNLKWESIKKVVILDEVFLQNVNGFIRMGVPIEVINSNEKIVGKFINVDFYGTSSESIAKFDDYQIGKGVYSTRDQEEKIENFLTRLDYPFELGEQAKQKMIAYLKSHKKEALELIFRNGLFEELQNNAEYLVTRHNIDEVMELSSKNENPALSAFLLNFKKYNLKIDPAKNKTLDLTPTDLNSFREVQKLWRLTDLSAPELTLSGYKGAPQTTLSLPPLAGDKPIIRIASESKISAPELIIPEGYKVIDSYAFSKKCNAEKIIMTDSVTTIGNHAFSFCKKLREIRLSDRVCRIEEETFRGCLALTKIDLPQNLVYIGPSAFSRCLKLQRLDLSEKVIEIGDDAFNNCPKLVIHAPKKSYPIEYARDNGIKYVEV